MFVVILFYISVKRLYLTGHGLAGIDNLLLNRLDKELKIYSIPSDIVSWIAIFQVLVAGTGQAKTKKEQSN
jgi:nitrate reductase gamma subunit